MWVARAEGEDEIVGFARWDYPPPLGDGGVVGEGMEKKVGEKEEGITYVKEEKEKSGKKKKLEEGEIQEIEGCRKKYLEGYTRLATEAKERSGFTKKRCWRKFVFLAVKLHFTLSWTMVIEV